MHRLKVGIDNYGLYPLELDIFQTLEWARANGAEGVQFSGLTPEESYRVDGARLKDLAQFASENNLYLEWGGGQHIPLNMQTWARKDIFEVNRNAAQNAEILGVRIVRSCSGGLMRWNPDNPRTEELLEASVLALHSQKQMLKDHNVLLAIETHFEFTTFELLRLLERCDTEPGEYLGICLDTMNLLTMLEDPVSATERILPWVVSTHIKDGGLKSESKNLISFPAEIGKGVIDLERIIVFLTSLSEEPHLSLEDHGGSFLLPVSDPQFRAEFPDLSDDEFGKLLDMARLTKDKMEREGLAIVEREEWPAICEERIRRDLSALKQLVSQ